MKPNFWNRIFHHKAPKPLYFVRGFGVTIPRDGLRNVAWRSF